jgi:hypothetical protein
MDTTVWTGSSGKTVWTGSSGKHYTYEVHSPLANWNSVGGNYIFASVIPGRWKAHHVGQTGDFRSRFSSHEKWAEAVRAGATHILVHTNPSEAARLSEESDLIR